MKETIERKLQKIADLSLSKAIETSTSIDVLEPGKLNQGINCIVELLCPMKHLKVCDDNKKRVLELQNNLADVAFQMPSKAYDYSTAQDIQRIVTLIDSLNFIFS